MNLEQKNEIIRNRQSNARIVTHNHQIMAARRAPEPTSNAHTGSPLSYTQYMQTFGLRSSYYMNNTSTVLQRARTLRANRRARALQARQSIENAMIRSQQLIEEMRPTALNSRARVDSPSSHELYMQAFDPRSSDYYMDNTLTAGEQERTLQARQSITSDLENLELSDELREMFSRYPDELTKLYLRNVDIQQIIAVREDPMEIAAMLICVDEVIELMAYHNFADIAAVFTPIEGVDVPLTYALDDFGFEIYNMDVAVATHHRVSILLARQRLSHDMANVPLSDELREMFSRYPDELTQLYLRNVDIQQIIAVRENPVEIGTMLVCVDEVIALMEYSNFADIGATFTPREMDAEDVPNATQMINDLL